MTRNEFVEAVGEAVRKLAPEYDIAVCSPIIAQCIVESGWGESRLATTYHNYFGIKAGTSWRGPTIAMTTNEEYTPGSVSQIVDAFRVYDSMEDGIRGYFDLIQLPRYANLKHVTDPETYCRLIKQDGYATDSRYPETLMSVIRENGLTRFDEAPATGKRTAAALVDVANGFLGYSEADGRWRDILAIYNAQPVLPRGYRMTPSDPWCATFVSACAIQARMTDLIPTECGCEAMIDRFKAIGRWNEDGGITPRLGDIIFYDWDTNRQPNDGLSDHVGIVCKVVGDNITVIEGNYNGRVGLRTIPVGYGHIRGYGQPAYDAPGPVSDVPFVEKATQSQGRLSQKKAWTGTVTADSLNVRTWAGTEYDRIKSAPQLPYGETVDVCDTVSDARGATWYYIRTPVGSFGFVHGDYIKKL